MKKQHTLLLAAILHIFAAFQGLAQSGSLDSDFHADGIVTSSLRNGKDIANAVALQPNGKIVLAGGSENVSGNDDFALAAFQIDGEPDFSFSSDGKLTLSLYDIHDYANDLAVQADGKIIAVGYSSDGFTIARFETDGSLDNTFSSDGKIVGGVGDYGSANAVIVQPDGKILVAGHAANFGVGYFNFGLARLNPDGSFDNAFSNDGRVMTNINGHSMANALAVQADGKIVLGGQTESESGDVFALVRYNPDGSLDLSFSQDGKVATDVAAGSESISSLAIQPDGKIIAAGHGSCGDILILRYNSDGNLDAGFGTNGVIQQDIAGNEDFIASVAIDEYGNILAAGHTFTENGQDVLLARFKPDGALDQGFGQGGVVVTDVFGNEDKAADMVIQPDGRIVLAGGTTDTYYEKTDFLLLRYLGGLNVGTVEFSPTASNPLIYPNPIQSHATLKYTLAETENLSIQLLDLQGRVVRTLRAPAPQPPGDYEQAIDLSGLPGGAYVVVLASEKGRLGVRVVKQ